MMRLAAMERAYHKNGFNGSNGHVATRFGGSSPKFPALHSMTKWLSIRLIHWFCPTARAPIEVFICVLIFSLFAVSAASSQDVWTPPTGDWSTAGNWSLGRVPLTTDDVVVNNGGTAVVSTAGGTSYTIHNLTIGATTAGSTVEINSGVTLHMSALTIGAGGTINVDAGGSFLQSGGFTNNGDFVINDASVNAAPIGGTGMVTKVSSAAAFWAAPLNAGASVIVNGGRFTDNTLANGNAGVNVTVNAGTFVDNTGSLGNVTVNSGTFIENTGTIGNATIIGATSVLQVNAGVTLNTAPVLSNGGKLDNFGTITASIDAVDSTVGGATVTNEAGGVITGTNFAGVFVDGAAGNVTNSGTISGNTAAVFLNHGGTVTNLVGGAIHGNANDGVFVNNGAATVTNSGTITGQNGVRFDGIGGSLTNNIGGTILASLGAGVGTFPGSFMNLTNSGTITGVSGAFFFSSATITNNAMGTITGTGGTGIQATAGPITLLNAGNINGNVILANFANSVTLLTGGKITGNLDAGSPAAASLNLGGTGTQVLSQAVTGAIGGFFSLAKQGAGTWIIDEDLSYTGGTTIASGGTLQIGNGGATGSIVGSIVNNGILAFNRSDTAIFGGTISGTGSVTKDSPGTLILTANNSFGGGTTIANGALQIGNGGTTGSISGNVIDKGALVFDRSDSLTFAGLISGSGSVAQNGSGTLILTGNDTYTGGTTINAGTIQLGNGGTTGSVAGNVIDNGALVFNRSDSVTFDGIISGAGTVTESGGTLVLNAANTYSGGTSINGGTIVAAANNALGTGLVNINDPSVLRINPGVTVTNFILINNTGRLDNFGTIQVSQAPRGLSAAVTTSGGATITNESGATISGVGINGIQSLNGSVTITNSGAILGIQGIQLGGDGTITNNPTGSITGSTGIAILASAGQTTLSNSGTINGNVSLTNASNTVQLFSGSRINGKLDLGGNPGSNLILDGGGRQILSQAVTGTVNNAGSLTKQGSGTWTLDVGLSAPISTNVLAGVLVVDSTLNTPVVNVRAGGTLAGSGIITGSVTNSGIVNPGDGPGTLQLSGNYTQNAGGTLRIGVASLTEHGLLAVGGHAGLGGTLQLVRINGFNLQPGNQVVFLTAQNGVSGAFNTVQNDFVTGTIVQGVVTTSANAVVLEGQQGSFTQLPGITLTPNQSAVGKMLNSAVGNPAAAPLFAFLNSQPVGNLPNDYNLIAPTQISSVNATAVSVGKVQATNLGGRMANIRGGSTGFSSAGFGISGGAASFGEGFAGVSGPEGKSGPPALAPTPGNRWGVFLTGLGEFTNVDGTPNAPGYDVNTGGFTLGVDYRLTPNFTLGLSAGYAHTSVSVDSPGGNIDVNAGTIGMYATVFGNGFYLDAAVNGGPSGYTTHRTGLQGSANGSTNGGDLNALVAGGYDWTKGNLTIGPTASFQYGYVALDGFSETGSLAPLKFPNQNTESERTAVGAKASYQWKIGNITAIPQFSAAWQHEFGSTAYSVVANLASGAGNSFTVFGPQIGRDSLLIGAGATVIMNDRVSAYLYYDGEFARTNYLSNNVTGGVRISF